jgi:hypothetical protein
MDRPSLLPYEGREGQEEVEIHPLNELYCFVFLRALRGWLLSSAKARKLDNHGN